MASMEVSLLIFDVICTFWGINFVINCDLASQETECNIYIIFYLHQSNLFCIFMVKRMLSFCCCF